MRVKSCCCTFLQNLDIKKQPFPYTHIFPPHLEFLRVFPLQYVDEFPALLLLA